MPSIVEMAFGLRSRGGQAFPDRCRKTPLAWEKSRCAAHLDRRAAQRRGHGSAAAQRRGRGSAGPTDAPRPAASVGNVGPRGLLALRHGCDGPHHGGRPKATRRPARRYFTTMMASWKHAVAQLPQRVQRPWSITAGTMLTSMQPSAHFDTQARQPSHSSVTM